MANMTFVPGLAICSKFYEKAVKPIMEKEFSTINFSAGLFGSGSEVLGFDTALSSDHDWRPRVFIFISDEELEKKSEKIEETIKKGLPATFDGHSTKVGENSLDPRNRFVFSIRSYFQGYLKLDPFEEVQSIDWLVLAEQRLLSVAKGAVFFDGLGELEKVRDKFSYFPSDVWLYLLASQWRKISEEEAFVGRAGDVGDELGSQIIAARLLKEIMKLCFLIERQYAPYSKWFGTAFTRLVCAKRLEPIFQEVLYAKKWKQREVALSQAYEALAEMHNDLKITQPMSTKVSTYHDRPYLVIHGDQFAAEITKGISDPFLMKLRQIGSIDQFVDCTEILNDSGLAKKLKIVFE